MLEAFQKVSKAVFMAGFVVTLGSLAVEAGSAAVFIAQNELTGQFNQMVQQAVYVSCATGLGAAAVSLLAAGVWGFAEYRKEQAERRAHMEELALRK